MALFYSVFDDHAVVNRYLPDDGINEVYIPDKTEGVPVTEIGPGAFSHSEELKTVVIPMTIERIGYEAFSYCESLTCVGVAASDNHSVFPSALKYIGEKAFFCAGLKELSFASKQLELDRQCFSNSKVTSAFFMGTDISIGDAAFMHSDLEVIAMMDAEIDYLGYHCFAFCKKLRAVKAKQVNGVGEGCFLECEELTEFPAKKPLDHVGNRAFFGCKHLSTTGFFRTIRDIISAWGDSYLINETVKQKCPKLSWKPEYYDAYNFQLANASQRVLEKIRNTTCWVVSDLILLNVIGSEYYNMSDGWDYADRFFLYAKKDITQRFREIWDWNITTDCYLPAPHPPMRLLHDLSDKEVCRMLRYENTPQPYTIDWDDLGVLLNAELGGDAAFYNYRMVTDFLSCLIDHEMGKTPKAYYDIPTKEIEERLFNEEDHLYSLTQEERIHCLKFDVLYNRLAIYKELKHTYLQLTFKNPPENND